MEGEHGKSRKTVAGRGVGGREGREAAGKEARGRDEGIWKECCGGGSDCKAGSSIAKGRLGSLVKNQ